MAEASVSRYSRGGAEEGSATTVTLVFIVFWSIVFSENKFFRNLR